MVEPVSHDELFKLLLTTFFGEFIELFFPEVVAFLEAGSVEFLDKEIITDVAGGERHEADLVAKARFRGAEAFFLIHVETQASAQSGFPRRMFTYFARLHEKHRLPVYPIALFSYDAPTRPEPDRYVVTFPNRRVLEFRFDVIQLNRLNWRDYVKRPNPVASALMAKMRIAPEDRPRVKVECLRLLATLRLNEAKMSLIGRDSYLKLTAAEETEFAREVAELAPPEQETVMYVKGQWEEAGELRALKRTVLRQLRHRFNAMSNELESRVGGLDYGALEELCEALLDFGSLADAEAWVGHRTATPSPGSAD